MSSDIVVTQARPLPSIAVHKINESLSVDWTYNFYSIEGVKSWRLPVPYGQENPSLLAQIGKSDAHRKGRNWVTTRRAIQD